MTTPSTPSDAHVPLQIFMMYMVASVAWGQNATKFIVATPAATKKVNKFYTSNGLLGGGLKMEKTDDEGNKFVIYSFYEGATGMVRQKALDGFNQFFQVVPQAAPQNGGPGCIVM